jgi:hypothetical protein
MANVTTMVRTKEAGRTLAYQFVALGGDSSHCVVHEAYKDRTALLSHFANLGENGAAATALDVFTVDELLVIGDVPEEIIAQLRTMVGDKLTHYSHVLSQA